MASQYPRDRIVIRTSSGPTYLPLLDEYRWTYEKIQAKATDIQVVRGVGDFIYFNQAPDVGHVIIKSRNRDLDPLVNPSIKANKMLNVEYSFAPDQPYADDYLYPLFRGTIKDVSVKYNPKDEPEITISAVDNVGILAAHEISESFANRPDVNGVPLTLEELFEKLPDDIPGLAPIDPQTPGFSSTENQPPAPPFRYIDANYQDHNGVWGSGDLAKMGEITNKPNATTYVKAGDNAYDLITKLAQADLMEIVCNARNIVYAQPHFKWHSAFWVAAVGEIERQRFGTSPIEFSTLDMSYRPYFNVSASDGEKRMINYIVFRNTSRDSAGNETVTEYGPYVNQSSIDTYGQKGLVLETFRNDDGNLNNHFSLLADEVLRIGGAPKPRINSFQMDATKFSPLPVLDPVDVSNMVLTMGRTWVLEYRPEYPFVESVGSLDSGTFIDKTIIDMEFNTNPDDPSNGIVIGGGSEVIGVKHFINGQNWTVEFLLSNDSKQKQLQENIDTNLPWTLRASGDPKVQDFPSSSAYTELRLFKDLRTPFTEGPIDDGTPSDVSASDFDNITNWYWVFGNNGKHLNDTSQLFHSTTPELDGTVTHGWTTQGTNPLAGLNQTNGYYDPNKEAWVQPQTLYLKDNNGWIYLYGDQEYI